MSVTIEVTIWCEGCAIWETKGGVTPDSLRNILLTHGWTCINGKDYCNKCAPYGRSRQDSDDALIERLRNGDFDRKGGDSE